jgi:hypothetical protein
MDDYGYEGCESYPGALACTDISSTGTPLWIYDEDYAYISIGFSFNFYGTSYNNVGISDNGVIHFADGYDWDYSNPCPLPTSSYNAFIGVYWDDLNPEYGQVYAQTIGSAPNRIFVVQWDDVARYYSHGAGTFIAQLYEGSNDIRVCYYDTYFDSYYSYGDGATVGIQPNSSDALEYSCNSAVVYDGLELLYLHP